MLIRLYSYDDKSIQVEIPDNVDHISGIILSGDMVMKYPFEKDSSEDRLADCYDGFFDIPKEKFHKLNTLEGENKSYQALNLTILQVFQNN